MTVKALVYLIGIILMYLGAALAWLQMRRDVALWFAGTATVVLAYALVT